VPVNAASSVAFDRSRNRPRPVPRQLGVAVAIHDAVDRHRARTVKDHAIE
jgi:hypothetical protein